MANASIMPFGSAPSLEVAYVAGVSLISNMHTAERMEAFARFLLCALPGDHRDYPRTGGAGETVAWKAKCARR